MKKYLIVAVVAVVIVIGASVFMWGDRSSDRSHEVYRISSSDKSATFTIPKSALPSGVTSQDLSIAKLDPKDYPETIKKIQPSVVYRLEPSGAQFDEPVTFSMNIEANKSGYWPMAVHFSEDSFTPLSNFKIKQQENGSFVMTGELRHFSYVMGISGFVDMDMPSSLGRHRVGESFTAPVTFHVTDRINTDSGDAYWQLTGRPNFTDSGHFLAPAILTPREIEMPPKETKIESATMKVEGSFTCIAPGFGDLLYVAGIDYDYEFYAAGFARPLNLVTYITPDKVGGLGMIKSASVGCFDVSAQELWERLKFDADTFCDGRVEIQGTLQHERVRALEFEIRSGGQIVSQQFDPTTGDFHLSLQVPVGQMYRLKITAVTLSGEKIFVSDPGFSVPICPEDIKKKVDDSTLVPPPKIGVPIIPNNDTSVYIPLTPLIPGSDPDISIPPDFKIDTDVYIPFDTPTQPDTVPEDVIEFQTPALEDTPVETITPIDTTANGTCGDGIVQKPNKTGVVEACDPPWSNTCGEGKICEVNCQCVEVDDQPPMLICPPVDMSGNYYVERPATPDEIEAGCPDLPLG